MYSNVITAIDKILHSYYVSTPESTSTSFPAFRCEDCNRVEIFKLLCLHANTLFIPKIVNSQTNGVVHLKNPYLHLLPPYPPLLPFNFLLFLHRPSQSDDSSSFFLNGLRFGFIFTVNRFGFSSTCLNLALIRILGGFVWALLG